MVSYYLDGGINMTGHPNYGNMMPDPDALQEFRVETSNFSAAYGRMSSAVVTAVTRSGTNHFHGSLFEFVRNTDLNATPWNSTLISPYHRNQFGGTVGGPVKHDKAFFFFSYGGLRQTVGQFLSGGVVPTSLERTGNFYPVESDSGLDPANRESRTTTTADARMDSSVRPGPDGGEHHQQIHSFAEHSQQCLGGLFHRPDEPERVSGEIRPGPLRERSLGGQLFQYSMSTQNAYGNGNILWDTNQSFARQQNANLSDVHSFSASTTNQAWFNFTKVAGGRVNLPSSRRRLGSDFTLQGVPAPRN